MEPPLLEVDDLRVEYRAGPVRVQAVRGATLAAHAGEVVGIVGESGCGKSTLAAAIAGLQPAAAHTIGGTIRFGGLPLDRPRQQRLRGDEIAVIFQDPMRAFSPVLTIGAQLVDFQHRTTRSRAERKAQALTMLERVGIPDPPRQFRAYPHELSGGMRQRVAIAAALLTGPRLLIADEPTSALDVITEAQIVHLLAELRRGYQGAILIVTHHLAVVAQLCDRICVMYAGEVVESGTTEQVLITPRHPYTRALLACDPALVGGRLDRLPVIPGHIPDLAAPVRGCAFATRCDRRIEACTVIGAVPVAFAAGQRALCREGRA